MKFSMYLNERVFVMQIWGLHVEHHFGTFHLCRHSKRLPLKNFIKCKGYTFILTISLIKWVDSLIQLTAIYSIPGPTRQKFNSLDYFLCYYAVSLKCQEKLDVIIFIVSSCRGQQDAISFRLQEFIPCIKDSSRFSQELHVKNLRLFCIKTQL